MKKYARHFLRSGFLVCGSGPVVWAVVYAILNALGVAEAMSVEKMVVEVLSVTLLAFIAGGISVVYQIERLPLVAAFLIHASVLYLDYIVIYLMNGWLGASIVPLLVFTSCFVAGFSGIWFTVYFTTKKSADKVNERLERVQSGTVCK